MNTENANANTNGIASGEVIYVTDLQQQQHIQPNQNITDIFFESDIKGLRTLTTTLVAITVRKDQFNNLNRNW